ncbi:hypothetical protein DICSQDRAFT_157805 [Dichomitus squalens LYAD-421 SS1]|uniref:Phosphatidylglycerol/phosphatidylinositol transfer protein n=2 Tax=Dichomitus squalens TaxID=114155 RepID=A0A4Q9Q4J2_9APHY|nr:uncharacterized protein DICSQDRAFT_157805 [Dichomitus squalens LYAD-421 SS1]EJF56664.1 hypothetical protein DICSQDRAFT_157805 [Dichomitus squalens LYAD-421 SS1]TBU61826.1 hypothetical protein BD310DRAFT_974801 [Dichomitus squalens]
MLHLFILAFLVASAFAQRCQIAAPAEWSTVAPGSNITVEVDRPMTLSSSQEVAVVIGFWACNGPCNETDVTQIMGNVVYSGPYSPQLVDAGFKPPYQNFTVTVPSHFVPGREVSLNVAHFTLIGAGLEPFLETLNITLNIGSA